MTGVIGSSTASGMIDYLDSLVEKGRSRPGVVNPLKTAITKVLEKTEGEGWGRVDVTALDVDDVMARFKNMTLGIYNTASYKAYESRMRRSLSWYKRFLSDPGWAPKERASANRSKPAADTPKQTVHKPVVTKAAPHPNIITVTSTTEAPKSEAIPYPFPLANGQVARIFMPAGLKNADVDRLTLFLKALVINPGEHSDGEK